MNVNSELIRLRILTPEGVMFDEDVVYFNVCLSGGYATILKRHERMISYISDKPSKIFLEDGEHLFCLINDGLLYVNPTEIKVFAKMFALMKNLNRQEIQENYNNLLEIIQVTKTGYKRMQLEAMLEFELQKLKWVH